MAAKLSAYNTKRDFERTPEPEGGDSLAPAGGPLRFVVHRHWASREHYDLRLEWDGVLLSWAVPKGPSYNPHDKRLAVHVEDHPLDYRTFEGTIPKGEYGGGEVMLWDEGTWEPHGDVDAALRDGELKFALRGRRLKGDWVLVRLKPRPKEHGENWLLIKEHDGLERDVAGIEGLDTSVATGRTRAQIAEGDDGQLARNPFDQVDVELAKLVSEPPARGTWLYEVKYDGYRIVAFVEAGESRLVTRNGVDYTGRFPSVASALADLAGGRAAVLDGELVVTDEEGRSDFQALQGFLKHPAGKHPSYVAFDLLALDGEDLRARPLAERKQLLAGVLAAAPPEVRYSEHVEGRGQESFEAACKLGLEGVVGKRADSPYRGARTGDWIKLKCDHRQEFVVGGFTRTAKKPGGVSALLLGAYEGGALAYAGRVGSGIGEDDARELLARFEGLERADAPFANPPKPRSGEESFWLEPELVAEVKFAEWTDDGQLRHPSYQGLRIDKDPRDVRREETEDGMAEKKAVTSSELVVDGVTITSPGKLLFTDPDVTKEDVVRYYARVADAMLPFAGGRVLSIVRCPRGIGSACFFKKHPSPHAPGIVTVEVPSSDGEPEEYFYVDSARGILEEAQMDTLEFHVWGSRVETLEQPDLMVFDLDPDKGLGLDHVRRGARDLKGLLEELGLETYLKTSGGKGYHVVVPFQPEASWDAFRDFAKRIAQTMAEKWPDRYTSNVRLAKRTGKVYIDWMRNGRGATSIAPYSLRARTGARVSLPISWDELDDVAPDAVTMADALKRVERGADPWKGIFEHRQALRG
ncbi:DNA ligase D [Arabiibacter massiliensis]|uniref:DNA ligase D n=1 Tax=Arabiibacter massiliensis TaxID=1870985 RepID=UPI0009B9E03C|nr:DNA ligase D [Arabiibacter massiliensis]